MSRCLQLVLLGLCVTVMDDAPRSLYAQGAYPRVMSPTGRFYGPTQAHYQYERQYGRPWHGGPAQFDPNTGANFQVRGPHWGGHHHHGAFYPGYLPFGGYGYGYGFGFPAYGGYAVYQNQFGFGPIQQYQTIGPQGPQGMLPLYGPAPTFSWQQPGPFQQPLLQQPQAGRQAFPPVQQQPGNGGPVIPAAEPEPVMARPHNFLPPAPSTVAQRQRSLHLQGQGDIWFRQLNYLQAYSRYKQAAGAAPDLAAPRFRMAYALMAMQRYELAVPEFQRGIKLDPQYPLKGDSPQRIYGDDNRIAAAALPQAVAAWVRQDIRSSDRLFLMGALLMISGDHVRAKVLLETAAQFGAEGPTEHIVAFLRLDNPAEPLPQLPAANGDAANGDDQPPVPEEVERMLRENQNWLPPVAPQTKSGAGVDVPRPQKQPNPPVEIGPALPVVPPAAPKPAAPKPAEPKPTVQPQQDVKADPGFLPIPKKGTTPQPQPAEQAKSDIQPASQEAPDKPEDGESGPVIPIPGAGK